MLCNKADLVGKGEQFVLDGDPTEGAMFVAALKARLSKEQLQERFTIVKEFPFHSTRKMISVIIKDEAESILS